MSLLAVSLGFAAVSALGSISAGNAAAAQAEARGKIAEQEAAFEARQRGRQGRQLLARQRTGFAKGGVQLIGSPLLVLADTETQLALEQESLRRTGISARNTARAEASAARTAGLLGGAKSLLSGGIQSGLLK